ncbi:hypothetical protein HID58_074687 [Brassica napus]|uniref:Uncharacterized protein n=1 Tax=Brassica napus TaxID=3708 RepID=A0ABQ7YHG7_BRANA|nr:hypothetical protein HID58_074687 [Brassica napus]
MCIRLPLFTCLHIIKKDALLDTWHSQTQGESAFNCVCLEDPLSPSSNVSAFHYYVLNSDLLRDYPIPSTGKQSIDLFASHSNRLKVFTKEFAVIFRMITTYLWIPKRAPKAMPDDAEPHSEEKINGLVYNGTLKKSIYYLSDMDDVDKRMEHEIDSGEVAHAKAVGTSFGKHCSKYNYSEWCLPTMSVSSGYKHITEVSDDQRERLAMSVERLCLEIELESRKTMMETEDLGLYGSVNAHRLNTFRHLFSESSLYSISGFEAKPSNNKFKISYSPLYIRCVSSVDGISCKELYA